jgi:hypothetical protein
MTRARPAASGVPVLITLLLAGTLLSSCAVIAPFARSTPAGNWMVVTDPAPVVGRPVKIIFRFRDGAARPSGASFEFTVTCTTCPEPKLVVTGIATKDGDGTSDLLYSTTVTFPSVGSWWTSPYVGPIEVR